MGRRCESKETTNTKEISLSKTIKSQKGFTYIELMILISFLTVLFGYLFNLIYVTQIEKEKQKNQIILQHSYQIGYSYLKNRVLSASNLLGGGGAIFLEGKDLLEAFRFDGVKVIREVRKGKGDLDGTVIVFEYVDSIQFQILPNNEGIRVFGRLKLDDQILPFDEIIMKRISSI